MKKLLFLLLLAGAGAFVYYKLFPPEKRSCAKLTELCGVNVAGESCESGLLDLKKGIGDEGAAKLHDCIGRATSCPEASGCMAGAAMGGAAEAMGKFMKGLGDALKK
jgi:hypothetical protein